MLIIHFTALLGTLLFTACYFFRGRKLSLPHSLPCLLFVLALLLRLTAAACSGGFDNDTACFASWADRIFQTGPSRFYSTDFFADYPPGYLYLLYPVGALRSLLRIDSFSPLHLILLRLPAIFCDLGCGVLLYRAFFRRLRDSRALLFCGAYLFNPAVILNSSVWGQTDAVYTLPVLLMCCFLSYGNTLGACLTFSLGLLVKPQTLIFAPVLLTGLWDRFRRTGFSREELARIFLHGLLSILSAFLLIIPFGPANVLRQYADTVGSYPYAAVNACNLWGFFGLNWVSQDNTFLGLPYRFYGWSAIFAAVLLVFYLSFRYRESAERYSLLAGFLITAVFVFSVRMHERYLFPALALLLLSCARIPSRRLYFCYAGFSLLHFYNTAQVLFFYDPYAYDRGAPLTLVVSALTLLLTGFFFRTVFTIRVSPASTPPGNSPLPGSDAGSVPLSSHFLGEPDDFLSLGSGAGSLPLSSDPLGEPDDSLPLNSGADSPVPLSSDPLGEPDDSLFQDSGGFLSRFLRPLPPRASRNSPPPSPAGSALPAWSDRSLRLLCFL